MSSHHIVRDEQEPALILHQVDGFSFEILETLLEWSPTIVCCESALESALVLGIKLDVVIVDSANEASHRDDIQNQQPVTIIQSDRKDQLTKAIEMLQESGHQAVNVISTNSKLAKVIDLARSLSAKIDMTFWDESRRHVLIRKSPFQKWLPTGVRFSMFLIDAKDHLQLKMPGRSDFESITNGDFTLEREGTIEIRTEALPFVFSEEFNC